MSLIDVVAIPTQLSAGMQGHVAMHGALHSRAHVYQRSVWLCDFADGSDITAALQAEIDAVQTAISRKYGYPAILIPPGRYRLSDTITVRSASIIGGGSVGTGATLYWDGAPEKDVLVKDKTAPGGMSWWECANLRFMPGAAEPACWLNLTASAVDVGARLHDLHLDGGGYAIRAGYWINCHWRDLRFDNQREYCLSLTPPVDQFLSSFRLDGFTYDHKRADAPGKGFLLIDLTADPSNVGVVRIQSGRIELNTALSAPAGIVTLRHPNGETVMPRSVGLHLNDVTVQDVTNTRNAHLLYRETDNATTGDAFIFDNLRLSGLAGLCGGSWSPTVALPEFPMDGLIDRISYGGAGGKVDA